MYYTTVPTCVAYTSIIAYFISNDLIRCISVRNTFSYGEVVDDDDEDDDDDDGLVVVGPDNNDAAALGFNPNAAFDPNREAKLSDTEELALACVNLAIILA